MRTGVRDTRVNPVARRLIINKLIAPFLLLISILACTVSNAQRHDLISEINKIIQETDSLSSRKQTTFHWLRDVRKNKTIRETWHYTISNGRVIIFQVHYWIDSTEYNKVYYLDRGRLIYSEEYETVYYPMHDEIRWGRVCYFEDEELRQVAVLGHNAHHSWYFGEGIEAIMGFNERYSQLKRYIR